MMFVGVRVGSVLCPFNSKPDWAVISSNNPDIIYY